LAGSGHGIIRIAERLVPGDDTLERYLATVHEVDCTASIGAGVQVDPISSVI